MHEIDHAVMDAVVRLGLGADPVQVRTFLYACVALLAARWGGKLAWYGAGKGWRGARAGWQWMRTPRPVSRECQALLAALEKATFHPAEVTPSLGGIAADELRAGLLTARVEPDGFTTLRLDDINPLRHLSRREQDAVLRRVGELLEQHRAALKDVERSLVLDALTQIAGPTKATFPMPMPPGSDWVEMYRAT